MHTDKIEIIHGSVVQHGHHNDRIYLMHLHGDDHGTLIATLEKMAIEQGYGKIFAKIPVTCWQAFQSAGYIKEAIVPGFFNGKTEGLFIAKFFSEDRRNSFVQSRFDPVESNSIGDRPEFPEAVMSCCSPVDADEMANLYRKVFESYAFPIHRSSYIRHMMKNNVVYFCVRVKKRIAALAAAEIDDDSQTSEMTDFATLPVHRCKGLAGTLLDSMEAEVWQRGIRTAYTIARADSPGVNLLFMNKGYHFGGRLVKNTQIGGRIRSMNVWYRSLNTGK